MPAPCLHRQAVGCSGFAGSTSYDSADGLVTMGDLTALLDHFFIDLTPLDCVREGNMDRSGGGLVTTGDLTALVDHLFISLAPLSECPE